jgi:PKD domain
VGNAPVPPGDRPSRRPLRFLVGSAVTVLLLALAFALWFRRDGGAPPGPPPVAQSRAPAREVPPAAPSAPPVSPPPAPKGPASPAVLGDVLSAALHEERVLLPSSVRIEGIDQDRPWVCAGEAMGLSARLGGVPEPGAVQRWVWPVAGGGAELHPGPALQWRAPETAGRYLVRFQVCTDLGGRRVGVLAERDVEIDVRRCGGGEGQRDEPLRLAVVQQGQGTFAFEALYQGGERTVAFAWDFGDGTATTTTEPRVEHTYPLQGLEPQEVKSFTVRLQARLGRGGPLEATAFALVRGQPPAGEPPPVDVQVSRWRPLPEGGGWRSDVVVRGQDGTDVTWERLERIFLHWDGQADTVTRSWREAIHVEEQLEHGGFRGYVTVSASEAAPDIKQILDFLYGRDAAGQEVVVSWSPFKREASPGLPSEAPAPPPRK